MYYEVSDVARALNVADATVRLWEREGRFDPPCRTPKGRRIFTEEQLATLRLLHLVWCAAGRPPGRWDTNGGN